MADTEIIQSRAFEAILGEFGVKAELTEHGTVQVPGRTTREIWEEFKQKYHIDADVNDLTERKRGAAMKELEGALDPMPGLLELLLNLKEHDIELAVATSSLRDRAELIMGKIGVREHFPVAVTAEDITHVKPAPDSYLEAMRLLQTSPEDCVAFEDSDVGIQAAKAAGMKVIAIPNTYTHRMDFSAADLIVDSLEELSFQNINDLFA